ncbi:MULTISPECIES: VCBS domain-containing protein [Bradyrhizobium]|uniref:VCBS domain-containing protein n=1 Tax=Bradyrhizobium TaxID=374 RepID=UPI0003FBA140|nr:MULTISPECIES: VCBS domain-containing protein [Bradyrhizobium]UFW49091.1 VCBS domain-containing protein [Bradyrhizobium arachidis]
MDGQGSRSPADLHIDSFTGTPFIAKAHGHVPDGAVVVPDANLIFSGEFKRAGLDLVLSHDGHEFVVHDYFRGDKRAAVASPDGAHLTGDVVNALTGHVQYAQAASGVAAAQVIGHVTKLSGSATAIRNGVSVILNNGDNVEKGDVVSTGADSTIGITFIDGTVFGLSSNARMVLNEMVYDPNGSSNSSLLSLVAGTITFVAGETAKHGDMKIDTPVATMGIRGTAVLTQINFVVPAGGGDPQPQASFQVLVEPNGTTGSYILFDKVTLLPIATVNQAGQMIQISGGNVSITNGLLSPDVQKLITDVFTLKFTDNNTNTKLTTNFTDTITQTSDGILIKTPSGATAILTFTNLNPLPSTGPGNSPVTSTRIPGPPDARSLDANGNVKTAFTLTEHANATGGRADGTGDAVGSDTISGRITFVDQNLGDQPTVSISLGDAPNYVYKNAGQQDVTGTLSALQKQDIAATQVAIQVVPDAANNNNGSAVWTYTIPDHVFDFLAAGETLTLTYMVRVNNNFAVNPESILIPITITIAGTNDKPVITTSVPTITFEGGTSVPGGPLASDVPTSGTLSFDDVDLTDTHTVSVKLTSATLPDGTVPPGPLAAFAKAMSVSIASGADSTGDGTGTINWSLADLPVYLADFIPKGEVLTLVYTVTLTDSQGATSQQTITVTITGTDAPAVVWIATDKAGAPSGGFWKDAANWETGTVPTINDDVIVITDQLHGLTPSYPVTIDTAAFAKSITMNDFGGPPPKLINQSSLTIAGALNMSADSILTNAATGTMSVGGKAEILDTSVLTNAGHLTLAGGGDFAAGATITNSGTIELSGGTLKTLAAIHNAGGTLKADGGTTLVVDGTTVDGGTVAILGTLELDGTSLIEDGTLNNSGNVNVKGTAEFAHETVSNTATGTIKVLANGWLTIDQGTSVTNTGHVTVDANGKLTISGASINGGTVTIAGTLESTGTSTIDNADITNTGTITVTSGTLTIDPATIHLITNHGLVQANGGVLDISGEDISNTASLAAINYGALKLTNLTVSNSSTGTITVDNLSKLYLTDVSINGGSLGNAGNLYGVSGSSTISAAVDNTGNIEVQAGTLYLSGGLSGVGEVIIDDGATLELAGATAQTITFAGGTGTLQLDKVAGQSFTGTITGQSSTGGTFTITGTADITTSSGNALAFAASGGALANPADIVLTPTGTLTGAAGGVVVTQNGTGAISLTAAGDIKGLAGNGITLRDSATGVGDITIDNVSGKATGTGANSVGVLVENLNSANGGDISITQLGGAAGGAYGIDAVTQGGGDITIDAGGAITGSSIYGIRSRSYGSGSQTVTTEAGSVITSGSSGIVVVNRAVSLDGSDDSAITVNAYGTINSGSSPNLAGNSPGGIEVGYTGATSGTNDNTDVNGTVVVNNHANITAAAGYGINAYNYGNGDVTVNSFAGTTISVAGTQSIGINAAALSGGAGDVTVTLGENVTISGATSYGIRAFSVDQGDISVTLAKGDSITSGSSGIVAVNYATAIAGGLDSTISVEAHGTIHSGATLNTDGTTPGGIIAGYKPGGTGSFSNLVNGDVTVDSDAKITADAGYGIEAFTWGVGDITVTTGQNSEITAAGTAIGAFDHGGGDVSVTNDGSATGAVGLAAIANGAGDVTIVNHGDITSTSLAGISVTQNETGATGSTHITNSGSIVAPTGHAAILIQENTTGSATIDNSGTIGAAVASTVTSTTYAIVETGGAITINNSHEINGNISVAHATFNNEAAGTWTVSGTSVFGNLSSIVNDGVIDLLNGASISGTGLNITNAHEIDSWGTASISGTIANTGIIEVHDGVLTLFGSLSGTGSVTVDAGALLKLDGTVSQTITLAGDGAELQIDTASFGGSISELSATDTIDLSTIKYGLGTSAVYVANADPSTGGVLTVTDADGKSISLNLTGADYSHAHFAGSDDGTGHTLITIHADDDAPALDTATATLSADFSERESTTGDPTPDPAPAATGSIHFTDIDLTDRPTASVTEQTVTLLAADGITDLTASLTADEIAALKSALSYQQTSKNNGTVTWNYSIADNKLDFLGPDQKVKVVSTITLDDGASQKVAADVTVTITGENDAPTVAAVTTGPLVDTATTDSFSDITGTLVGTDADHGETAGLTYAVLDATSHAVTTLAGHYGSLTVNADGCYTYVPDAAAINALSEGNYTDTFTVQTKDAHGATGTASFTVNVTGANDAPVITVESGDSASATTDETNAGLDLHRTLTLSDVDTADHVAVSATGVGIYLDGHLQADGFEGLSASDLISYLVLPSGDILNGTATHAQFTWEFNSGSQAFDFLTAGQTLSLQYTIVPNDGHTTGASQTITINIAGSNDAPTLDDATLASVAGNDSDPSGCTISDLFASKFGDADTGASFKAIAVSADGASSGEGVWQYEIAGTDHWVDISGVSDTSALVLSTDTLIRFVPAEGFSGTPGALGVHALDDTYTGAITTGCATETIDLTATGTGGTTPVSDGLTSIGTSVTAPVGSGPVINTENFHVEHVRENNSDIITDLVVTDTDAGAATHDFTVTVSTAHPGLSSVDFYPASGSLDDINLGFETGPTYNPTGGTTDPEASAPDTDQIRVTVTDKTTGLSDTVNFIFNEAGNTSQGITLQGTDGKDVIFATDTNDTLTGGGAKDQFVFAPGLLYDDNGQPVTEFTHTITDFTEGLDKIDLRQFSGVSSIGNLTIAQQDGTSDTLVTWHQQVMQPEGAPVTETETLLLKNVIAANLKASDFIFHIT